MLPKGNFKTDFLKYDTEEEDKRYRYSGTSYSMTKQNQN